MAKDYIKRRKILKTIPAATTIPLIGSVTAQDDSIADDSGPNIGYLKKNPTDPITQSEVKEIRQRVTKQGGSLSRVSTTSTDSPNKILLSKIPSSSERIITGYAFSLQQGHPIEKIVTAPEGIRNKTKSVS
ncbi:hypothetical protein [Natrinema pellirubrum]|uniref:hypothetical protein n=1 Tax=Natrinema pellirubrum TaxID=69525 RepID=UPI0012696C9C|nr:hypothetical protein [Natrinema pellirubrum]